MKPRDIACCTIIAASSALGAELSIPAGDQTLLSVLNYDWSAEGQGPGGGEDFESNPGNLVHVVDDSDGSTYGVASDVNLLATYAGDTIKISGGPGLGTIPIQAEGHAAVVGDQFDYALRVGTASNLTYTPWEIQINPELSEFIGQPAIIRVEASVNGSITSSSLFASSSANWFVKVNGQSLISGAHSIASGLFPFSDTNIIDIPTTIGSTVSVQAEGSLLGEVAIFPPDTGHASGLFSAFDVTVSLLIPACDVDLNADGFVDTADLGILLSVFGTNNPVADVNGDGVVDTADLGILLAFFGQTCVKNLV